MPMTAYERLKKYREAHKNDEAYRKKNREDTNTYRKAHTNPLYYICCFYIF